MEYYPKQKKGNSSNMKTEKIEKDETVQVNDLNTLVVVVIQSNRKQHKAIHEKKDQIVYRE